MKTIQNMPLKRLPKRNIAEIQRLLLNAKRRLSQIAKRAEAIQLDNIRNNLGI